VDDMVGGPFNGSKIGFDTIKDLGRKKRKE